MLQNSHLFSQTVIRVYEILFMKLFTRKVNRNQLIILGLFDYTRRCRFAETERYRVAEFLGCIQNNVSTSLTRKRESEETWDLLAYFRRLRYAEVGIF